MTPPPPTPTQYGAIPMAASTPDARTDLRTDWGVSLHAKIGLVVIGAAVLLLSATGGHISSQPKVGSTIYPVEVTSVARAVEASSRPCTFDECYDSKCDQELAPYTCLFHNGGPHGGCGPAPWIEGTCTEQCDLRGCVDLPIPDNVEDCDAPCSASWCASE